MRPDPIQLVVVADDLGRAASVNQAVSAGLQEGIVTAASLMAGGEAFEEAVRIAKEHRRLSVGLHVTVCDGRAVLPPGRVLEPSPVRAGVRLWRGRARLLPELSDEIAAQFDRAERAGLDLAHVDGHHHMHIHPLVFPIVCREASRRGVRWVRIPQGNPRDGRVGEWVLFGALAGINRRTAARHGLAACRRVYGLSRSGRVDEAWLMGLLPRLRPGLSELFVHPDLGTESGRRELSALTSPRVRARTADLGIELVSYAAGGPASS
ncbi:MAG: carbohydrate deacetylase [Candidatus Polarisedimenticolia bacterium]